MSSPKLKNDAQALVNKIKNYYKSLLDSGYVDTNAHDATVKHFGNVEYDLVCLGTERASVDWSNLIAKGYTSN